MGLIANAFNYIRNQPNNASFNAAVNAGWIDIRGVSTISFHVVMPSCSGNLIWEATNDEDPRRNIGDIVLTAWPVVLPAALATLAAPAAVAVNQMFSFGVESANKAAMPEAAWMKMRWAFSAGGTATGLNCGVCRKGP